MWGLLKKAGEFLAPIMTTNTVDEFKDACETALESINDTDSESTTTLIGALNNVIDYLTEELDETDMQGDIPCFDYLSGESILIKIVDSITDETPKDHIEHILAFFLSFINTKLSTYFVQMSVHRPFSKLLSLLPKLYLKGRSQTREFADNLWNIANKSSIVLEMMALDEHLPLVDFFCMCALLPGEEGNSARTAIRLIMTDDKLPDAFKDYVKTYFFPMVTDFIIRTASCIVSLQFKGSLSRLIEWIDDLLCFSADFPIEKVLNSVADSGLSQEILTVTFLLSFFVAKSVTSKVRQLAFSRGFAGKIVQALKSDDIGDKKSALAFLKIAFMSSTTKLVNLLPPQCNEQADVLSILPSLWLDGCEGTTGMDAYEKDAIARIQYFARKGRKNGSNGEVFAAVLEILGQFKTIPLSMCMSVTKVITLFVTFAPDLISTQLTDAYRKAVEDLSEVRSCEISSDEYKDSPELRAAILVEFGKELHTTFVAAEKIKATNNV